MEAVFAYVLLTNTPMEQLDQLPVRDAATLNTAARGTLRRTSCHKTKNTTVIVTATNNVGQGAS